MIRILNLLSRHAAQVKKVKTKLSRKEEADITRQKKKKKESEQIQKALKDEQKRKTREKAKQIMAQKIFESGSTFLDITKKTKNTKQAQEKKIVHYYNAFQAIELIKIHSFRGFSLKLNSDPKKGDQMVRGSAIMPAGLGKQVKAAVLCAPQYIQQVSKLGITLYNNQDIMDQIVNEKVEFQMLISTNQFINSLKKHAKFLGPRRLMPNLKDGTLVEEESLLERIEQIKKGQVNFKLDRDSIINVPIGKVDFQSPDLIKNLKAVVQAVYNKKSNTVKGKYFKGAFLGSTMGPSWPLAIQTIDPRSRYFLLNAQ